MTYDVVVVGAGVAGLKAACDLQAHGLSTLLVEAGSRVGGRAWTRKFGPWSIDAGCGWLHSANSNPLTSLLIDAGVSIQPLEKASNRHYATAAMSSDDRKSYGVARKSFRQAATRLASVKQSYLSDALEKSKWDRLIAATEMINAGAPLERISIIEDAEFADNGCNWRTSAGLGGSICNIVKPMEVRIECQVIAIECIGGGIKVITTEGEVKSRAVVVTVSPNVINLIAMPCECIDNIEAAASLPLGILEKVVVKLADDANLPSDAHMFGPLGDDLIGSYEIRPFGEHYIEGVFGGDTVSALNRKPGELAAYALNQLGVLLGKRSISGAEALSSSNWEAEKWIGGSYTYASVGAAAARGALAKPVAGRVFFAGEATHPWAFSTVHGAWLSGERAAGEVKTALSSFSV